MNIQDSHYPIVSSRVMLRQEDEDRYLCIDPATGALGILNKQGATILRWVRQNRGSISVSTIIERILMKCKTEDPNEISNEIDSFFLVCLRLGLISLSDTKGGNKE